MKFLLHISAAPESPYAEAALNFADALHSNKQEIFGLFFSGPAVQTFSSNASRNTLSKNWQALLNSTNQKALCCSAAAKDVFTNTAIPSCIEIAGLGQLVDLSHSADRVISFGSRENHA